MPIFFVLCPVCGNRLPLFGDEPLEPGDEPWNFIDCHHCGASVDFRAGDLIPDGRKARTRTPRPPRNGRRPYPNPPRWRNPR